MRIAVALSGGVDSLCALLLIRDAGHEAFAIHGQFLNEDPSRIGKLRQLCSELDVELYMPDLRGFFVQKVIHPSARAWAGGETPNPCAMCNREVKFGRLFEIARELGADMMASGHYASIARNGAYSRPAPGPAKDSKKDQSYFLSLLPGARLEKLLFPLEGRVKEECRKIVAGRGFVPPDNQESQDVCFLGSEGASRDFLARNAPDFIPRLDSPGPVLIRLRDGDGSLQDVEAGRHTGLWRYTIGQRKGLGIPHAEALHVLEKDFDNNRLILAPRVELALRGCLLGRLNIFVPVEEWPGRLYSKLRYRQKAAPVEVHEEGGKLRLLFIRPQFPGAAGQVATIEDEAGVILAAGLIEKMDYIS